MNTERLLSTLPASHIGSQYPWECLWLKKSPRASAARLLPQSQSLGQDASREGEGGMLLLRYRRALRPPRPAVLAGASPVACGQCELQGVGRQVWLCLTGVGSGRNLAQRDPE